MNLLMSVMWPPPQSISWRLLSLVCVCICAYAYIQIPQVGENESMSVWLLNLKVVCSVLVTSAFILIRTLASPTKVMHLYGAFSLKEMIDRSTNGPI